MAEERAVTFLRQHLICEIGLSLECGLTGVTLAVQQT